MSNSAPPTVPAIGAATKQTRSENIYVPVPTPDAKEEAKRRAERSIAMSNSEAAAFFNYRDRLAQSQLNPE